MMVLTLQTMEDLCTSVLSFYSVKSYEFQHRSVSRSFGMGVMNFWYLTCVCSILNFTYSWYMVLHHMPEDEVIQVRVTCWEHSSHCPFSPYLFSLLCFSRFVLFLLSYHMWFLCVLSESLGPTYEREHLCFEHWCNFLNADFSLHPFFCKSHDFIFLYVGKHPMVCLCHILPSSGSDTLAGPMT